MSWEPSTAELRDGETVDVDAHAARTLEQIRRGVEDGILAVEDLPPARRRQLSGVE